MFELNLNSPEILKPNKQPFVFLGGTCNGSTWRDTLMLDLCVNVFNPVVENWDEAAKAREDEAKLNAAVMLYVITPKQKGFYSIAELTYDTLVRKNTVIAFVQDPDGTEFDDAQLKSNAAICTLLGGNKFGGPRVFFDLKDLCEYMNHELRDIYGV